ncbi:M16 family metallopeptidase [Sphingomonas desiccabilis]|uniref:Insulinase family protein n=1 Tax=Sphingomonas desiccabilis TaxID=429134 RepID=A0A4Q2ITN5_9SPHN|nr:pitrilysin family protein [Sphingomonas desiccabilis]MBB3911381.1 zinc protease [Sphingomonas desiccabilis]RXZ31840.1 insulinase family protein [Sphingomonas desiccabilis]
MLNFRAALLLATALVPATAAAQQHAPAASAAKPPAPAPVAPLAYTERTLANGLKVYAIRDPSTANVAVQVWYDVGSKDDPRGRSGFAHMFEHLMFKQTRNLPSEAFDRLTEDVGGYNNASTADDYTNYFEVVPANHLERLLFAEADRMATLVVEPTSFASERGVVKEELRSRVFAQPYGKLFGFYLPMISYTRHPYARPGIGSIEDLDAATIDDIRAFHATYYRPDNAVLVVAGNFDPAQLDRWVDQYFAPVTKPDRPIPRVAVKEPPRTAATRHVVHAENTPLPAVVLSYQVPPDNHPDQAALAVLNAVLSTGRNSRLYQALVYRDQLAQSAETYLDSKKDTGVLAAYAIAAGGKDIGAVEAGLKREVARLRDAPVSAAELAEAKNEILAAALARRETAEGRAFTLANSVIVNGDPRAADRQLAAIAKVDAAAVQRVARRYLGENQVAVLQYLPQADGAAADDSIRVPSTVETRALTIPAGVAVHQVASDAERKPLPQPGPAATAALPARSETRLANGLRLVTVPKPGLPLVAATMVVDTRELSAPGRRPEPSQFATELLTEGTRTRSATQIAAEVEALGASLDTDAEDDGASVSLLVGTNGLAPAMGILADVVRNPAYDPKEIERVRTQWIDALQIEQSDPGSLAGKVAARAVFGDSRYGKVGTETSYRGVTREQIVASHGEAWRPDRATLILVGDITPAKAQTMAERLFGDWRASGASAAAPAEPALPATPRVVVVDLPGSGQAAVVVSRAALSRGDPRFPAARLASTVLGGGFSSRLNQEIRIKRGLSYGARSALAGDRGVGPFSATVQTKNESAPEVVDLIVAELRRIGRDPVPAAELATRKAVLSGGFSRDVETRGGLAAKLGAYVLAGQPVNAIDNALAEIEGVDAQAVQQIAAQVLDPAGASIVVVGDAKQFADTLRQRYPQAEVIPAGALDLDTPKLTR